MIFASYEAVWVRPEALTVVSTTIAVLSPGPGWVIEQDCVRPVVLMQDAVFGLGLGLLGAAAT